MSRETSKKWNLSVKQKRELIRLSEEEGKSSRQLAKFTEQKFGRKISHVAVLKILKKKGDIKNQNQQVIKSTVQQTSLV